MTLRIGSYATWIAVSSHGCVCSGFFQGLDGAGRLVFITVNGLRAVDANTPLRTADGKTYLLIEYTGKPLPISAAAT